MATNRAHRGHGGPSSLLRGLPALVLALSACGDGHSAAGKPLHAPANYDPSIPGWLACSRYVVEGDVLSVSPVPPDRMVTQLRVRDWVKPSSGPKVARIETADIVGHGAQERWPVGTHLFLRVDVDPTALPDWEFTGSAVERIKRAVPASRDVHCPYGPS
jgi:hypothetical protein